MQSFRKIKQNFVSFLTFYEKGAWALVILRERLGKEFFKKGVANYLEKYAFKNVTVDDFLKEFVF